MTLPASTAAGRAITVASIGSPPAGLDDRGRAHRRRSAPASADRRGGRDLEMRRIDDAQNRIAGSRLDEIAGIVPALRHDAGELRAHDQCGRPARSRRRWRSAPAPARPSLRAARARRPPPPFAPRRRARRDPDRRAAAALALSTRACACSIAARLDAAPAVSDGISKRTSRSPARTRSPSRLRQLGDARGFGRGDDELAAGRRGHDAGRGNHLADRAGARRLDLDRDRGFGLGLVGGVPWQRGTERARSRARALSRPSSSDRSSERTLEIGKRGLIGKAGVGGPEPHFPGGEHRLQKRRQVRLPRPVRVLGHGLDGRELRQDLVPIPKVLAPRGLSAGCGRQRLAGQGRQAGLDAAPAAAPRARPRL